MPPMSQKTILSQLKQKKLSLHALESILAPNHKLAIDSRRKHIERSLPQSSFENVPMGTEWKHGSSFWSSVHGAHCENVVGFVPLPVGVVGPVPLETGNAWVPMATTEGALIASTNRGAATIRASGSVIETAVTRDCMTRAPVVSFPKFKDAIAFKEWCEQNLDTLKSLFAETTSHGKLLGVDSVIVGANVYMRFQCSTGEAMGMNMVTKGVEHVLFKLTEKFPQMKIVTVSANYCSDKKLTAVNWINGRGKTVCASVDIDPKAFEKVLKTDIHTVTHLHTQKNLVGSALAGAIGGFNAHAANIVAGVFLATGQDAAQVVESSACLTHFEIFRDNTEEKLRVSVTMPCIEVGSIGGGTRLRPQNALMSVLCNSADTRKKPGGKAQTLAKTIAATVLCGEISLLAAQATGDLSKAHMRLNRK